MNTLVPAQEGELKYCLETGTTFIPVPGKPGEYTEDPRKFTYHRAYVENPWAMTMESRFQTINVFEAPTRATALRIARRLEALLPNCTVAVEEESNYAMFRLSHTPWAVVLKDWNGRQRMRIMAGRHSLFLTIAGWHHWKGEIKLRCDEVAPDLIVRMDAEEPRD